MDLDDRKLEFFHAPPIQEIIAGFQEYQTEAKNPESERLQIEYQLAFSPAPLEEVDQWVTVQLKVGTGRLYVVKKIRDFLQAYKQGHTLSFTKNFVYDPTIHDIDESDKSIIRFLLHLLDGERVYRDLFDPWSSQHVQTRSMIIPPYQVRAFLELLPKGCTFVLDDESQVYHPLSMSEHTCPIVFSIKKQGTRFLLQSKCQDVQGHQGPPEEPYLLSEDGTCFAIGKIYRLNKRQQKLILPLHQQIQRSRQQALLIPLEQMDHVASDILPTLKKEAHLTIEQSITDQIVQLPLEASIYLDRIVTARGKERLTARVIYAYGAYTIDPMKEHEKELGDQRIFVRDSEREKQIMRVFERMEFKYNGRELYLETEGQMYEFLHKQVPRLEKLADLYTTEALEQIVVTPAQQPVPKVDLDPTNHWLEVSFDIPDVDEEELAQILQAFVEKRSYYRSQSGAFIPLPEEMGRAMDLFSEEETLRIEGNQLKLPAYRAMQLDTYSDETQSIRWKKGQHFRRLIQQLRDPENVDLSPPESLEPILRDYQRFGFKWLKMLSTYRFGGILADDMGLGKTLQVLSLIVSEVEARRQVETKSTDTETIPALVVVPASLIYNWQKECTRFAPSLRTLVINGDQSERKELLTDIKDVDLIITSYPLLRRDIDHYEPYFFQTLILDEAQVFKNQRTLTAQAVKRIQAGKSFALSGTPIENRLDELWSICEIVMPGLFPSQRRFRKLTPEQIARRIRPFILRRLKQDVLTELPDKIETVKFLDLTEEQKKVYLASLQKIQAETRQRIAQDGFQKSRMQILAGLTRLRQICCHPGLYVEQYPYDSGKMTYLFEVLEELLSNGHRVLIFSQFTSMLSIIGDELKKHELPYHYLDGQTPSKQRLEMVDRFNDGEHDIFLISLRAGGTGLNLVGADTVILYDLWWNPAVERQATDRAHRMGQKKKVQVIKLISQGTIEEKIHELHQTKQALVEQVIQPGEQMISAMSEDELREILEL